MIRTLLLMVTLAGSQAVFAADPAIFKFDNPSQEARFQQLAEELRCLVCQNQSLADSHADLAGDLRREIHQKMQQGASNEEIVDFLVQRYGDFVLYRPPMRPTTYLLWFGPVLLLLLGFGVFIIVMRRRHQALTPTLSEAEHRRMAKLLEEEDS
ncbi:cytochrome c-type biogenesis protein [Nitrosococcus watsonii]|uniref:Cytochrome c-type biogenesis protein n=1 Tax=Nitrosococcus watsoni (strain C-113) TaxID=105559 RepID=D8K464_NITWC|nr:cytochrome c-type biogenesis protein [Nitrosococcus watsonii]ADJ27761.1 cytochrome C biogenesis protein [Nitrosococcus watsonii C-113]